MRTAVNALIEIVKKDGDHKVIVKEPYLAGKLSGKFFGHKLPYYDCPGFTITNGVLTIKAGDHGIDGASLSPDKIGKLDLAGGYIPHDLGYIYMDDMATNINWLEAGWTKDDIRHMFDIILGEQIKHEGKKQGGIWKVCGTIYARLAYTACRVFGGVFHKLGKLVRLFKVAIIILAAFGIAGCDGCAIPEGVYTPADAPIPYEVITSH